jgi:hypothetical protein
MTYKDFFRQIRDNLKDVDTDATASVPSSEMGRSAYAGVRRIQGLFPETRLNNRGMLSNIEDRTFNETTANVLVDGELPEIPLPNEFMPALESHVMAWVYARDARDQKDADLMRHWERRFEMLTGAGR